MDLKNITQQDDAALERLAAELRDVYSKLPETKGCMENINAEGGCGGWCCQSQSPQVLYTEFCNAWRYVSKHWERKKLIDLVAKAIRAFLSNSQSKGCIFWDADTKLCQQHDTRPFSCRYYGTMPEEEWKPRYERLKVVNPELREQCGLVTTVDGEPVTKQKADAWWKALTDIEASCGIPHGKMNDKPGGTYRTYHDHIMLSLYPKQVLTQLTKMRLHGSEQSKEALIKTVTDMLVAQRPEQRGPTAGDGDGAKG